MAFVFLLSSCKQQENIKVLRLAHGLDTTHPVHLGMVFMGQRLEEKSSGKMKVRIYPGGQLGAERECLELLQIGSLDVTKVSSAVLENFITEYKVLSIPYLFKDVAHSHRVFDSEVGMDILNSGTEQRLKGLCFYDAGSRNFYTKAKGISSPSDLKGMKIRVQKSNMAVAMVQAYGGAATPIAWGELYTALQQGVVDGAENNLPSFYTSKHYEVCKYYSLNEHTIVPDVLLIGTSTWQRLTDIEKKWLKEAANESVDYQRSVWKKAEDEALKAIKLAGVQVIYPEKEGFIKLSNEIKNRFTDKKEALLITSIKSIE